MKTTAILLMGILLSVSNLHAQEQRQTTIHFDHNSHQLSGQTMALLDNLLNSTRGKDIIGVNITGYTDSDGEADYNMSLSKLRVNAARRYMLNQGIGQEKVKSSWFGEEKAIASNDTEEGKQKNRRVELSLSCQDASGPDIFSMFKKEAQVFAFQVGEDILIEGRKGTKIEIPANSLVDSLGMPPDGPIEISLQEYYSKSDIILANLHTMSDTMLLETAGMINIQAWSDGKKLQLHEGSEMFLEYAADSIPEGMQIFLGEEGDDQVDWVPQGGFPTYWGQGACEPVDDEGGIIMSSDQYDLIEGRNEDSIWAHENMKQEKVYSINRRMRARRLGWINCDRFYRIVNSTTLSLEMTNPIPQTEIRIVFRKINSIMPSFSYDGHVAEIPYLPVGQRVTVLAFVLEDEEIYWSSKDLVIERNSKIKLELKPSGKEEFFEHIEGLN